MLYQSQKLTMFAKKIVKGCCDIDPSKKDWPEEM